MLIYLKIAQPRFIDILRLILTILVQPILSLIQVLQKDLFVLEIIYKFIIINTVIIIKQTYY